MKFDAHLLKFVRGIATVGILVYSLFYIYTNLESFRIMKDIDWKYAAIMVAFMLVNIYASASENAILFRALGAPVGNLESFGLTNVSALFNLILPQGGTIAKAMYLKQKYKVPYSRTPAMYLGLLVIYLLVGSFMLLITNLISLLIGRLTPLVLWIAAGAAGLSSLIFMIDFPKGSLNRFSRIGVWVKNYSDGWQRLRTNRSSLIHACIWQFIIFISAGIWVSAAHYSLGIKISPLLGIGLSILSSFTNILVIIPGNFGIQEAIYGYFSYLAGTVIAQGIVVSALVRVALLLLTLVLAPISWFHLFYKENIQIEKPV